MNSSIIQIGLIIISIFSIVSFVQPMLQKIQIVQSESEEYDLAIEVSAEASVLLGRLEQQISQVSQQEKYRVELLVPDFIAPVELAYDIEALIKEDSLFLNSIRISQPTRILDPVGRVAVPVPQESEDTFSSFDQVSSVSEQSIISQEIEISVDGTYEQFKSLLAKIEQSARLIDVVSIKFESSDADVNAYAMTLRFYGLQAKVANIELSN